MAERKTIASVASDLEKHDAICQERWKTIYRKTDDLQSSVNSTKAWLVGGLTTIVVALFTLIIRGMI
jgi:hypothetical protein